MSAFIQIFYFNVINLFKKKYKLIKNLLIIAVTFYDLFR